MGRRNKDDGLCALWLKLLLETCTNVCHLLLPSMAMGNIK